MSGDRESAPAAGVPARRPRRHDPDRRGRILDAALTVIARHGVAGTTHRLIAAEAGVSLGSLTYHFQGLDDLRKQAFERYARRRAAAYERHFAGVRDLDGLIDAVTDMVLGAGAGGDPGDSVLAYELYLAAVRDPELRTITERWMRSSRAVLGRILDAPTTRAVDALIEGLGMHELLATRRAPRAELRAAVAYAVSRPASREDPR